MAPQQEATAKAGAVRRAQPGAWATAPWRWGSSSRLSLRNAKHRFGRG